jgi:hypothetical protein
LNDWLSGLRDSLGVVSEPIVSSFTFSNRENQISDRDKQPPPAVISVVHPTNAYGDTRNQDGQFINSAEHALVAPKHSLDEPQHERNDKVEEEKIDWLDDSFQKPKNQQSF